MPSGIKSPPPLFCSPASHAMGRGEVEGDFLGNINAIKEGVGVWVEAKKSNIDFIAII